MYKSCAYPSDHIGLAVFLAICCRFSWCARTLREDVKQVETEQICETQARPLHSEQSRHWPRLLGPEVRRQLTLKITIYMILNQNATYLDGNENAASVDCCFGVALVETCLVSAKLGAVFTVWALIWRVF